MSPSFRIEDVPGKGMGVVASKNIPAGTLLVSETPLVAVLPYNTAASILSQLQAKTAHERRRFFDLENNFKEMRPIEGIVRTNAMPLGHRSQSGGVFLQASRFNHSCCANAAYHWNTTDEEERVYAVRDIAAGEEISVCYLSYDDWALPRRERMKKIREIHAFECDCARCGEQDMDKRRASDERRSRVVAIEKILDERMLEMQDPCKALALCREALGLLEEEQAAPGDLQSIFEDACRICVSHGDLNRGSVFASLAADEQRKMRGADGDYLGGLEALVVSPQTHSAAFATSQWLTNEDPVATNEWLWRRAADDG